MLENLFELVKQQAGDTIINNPAIPNEQRARPIMLKILINEMILY